jgi:hypothetical protein
MGRTGLEHQTLGLKVCSAPSGLSRRLVHIRNGLSRLLGCDGPGRDRTCDLGIKSPLLYQLSYRPAVPIEAKDKTLWFSLGPGASLPVAGPRELCREALPRGAWCRQRGEPTAKPAAARDARDAPDGIRTRATALKGL